MKLTRELGQLLIEANEAFFSAPNVTPAKQYNNGMRSRAQAKEGEEWYTGNKRAVNFKGIKRGVK